MKVFSIAFRRDIVIECFISHINRFNFNFSAKRMTERHFFRRDENRFLRRNPRFQKETWCKKNTETFFVEKMFVAAKIPYPPTPYFVGTTTKTRRKASQNPKKCVATNIRFCVVFRFFDGFFRRIVTFSGEKTWCKKHTKVFSSH